MMELLDLASRISIIFLVALAVGGSLIYVGMRYAEYKHKRKERRKKALKAAEQNE